MAIINEEEYEYLIDMNDDIRYIARDYHGRLWAYEGKPYKTRLFWVSGGNQILLSGYVKDLFEFIQWSDDDPWVISELVSEYEKHHGLDKSEYRPTISKRVASNLHYFQKVCDSTYSDFAEYMTDEHHGYFDEYVDNEEEIMLAWLNGYNIEEEEPLYYVRMPNTDDYLTLESGELNFQEWLGKTPTSIKQLFTRHELEKYDKIYWGNATLAEGVDRQ